MPWQKPQLVSLNLYYNETLRDHAVCRTCPGEGYELVEQSHVCRLYKSPLCSGNGILLEGNTTPVHQMPRVIAENILLPAPDWELRFEIPFSPKPSEIPMQGLRLLTVTNDRGEALRLKLVTRKGKDGQTLESRVEMLFDSLAGSQPHSVVGTINFWGNGNKVFAITFISNKLTLYFGALQHCFMQVEGFTGTEVSIVTHTEDDTTPLAQVPVNDITLFEIEPLSEWEFHLDESTPHGKNYFSWGKFIRELHHAQYGSRRTGDYVNITDQIRKRIKNMELKTFKVHGPEFGVSDDRFNLEKDDVVFNYIITPDRDYYPYHRSYRTDAKSVVAMHLMWHDQHRKHVLTPDRERWEQQGYRCLHIEGYAYKSNQNDLLLTSLELYKNSVTADVCPVANEASLNRLEKLGGYDLVQEEPIGFAPACS